MDTEIRTTQDLLDYSDQKTGKGFYTVPENYMKETR